MSAKYWIKLYHEILYDRKMATMSADLWQRTIQMFLLAGERLTKKERELFDQVGTGPLHVVVSLDDALQVISFYE